VIAGAQDRSSVPANVLEQAAIRVPEEDIIETIGAGTLTPG
jgi:hypothetical protein